MEVGELLAPNTCRWFLYIFAGSLDVFRQRNRNVLRSSSINWTCRKIDSVSAVIAIGPSLNLKIVPNKPCRRSRPAISLSFKHTYLYFEAAMQTRWTLPGLYGLRTGWWGRYHSRYRWFSDTSLSILGIAEIFSPRNLTDQEQRCNSLVVSGLIRSTEPELETFLQWTTLLLKHLLCFVFLLGLTFNIEFVGISFNVLPFSNVLCHFHINSESNITAILVGFSIHWTTDCPS